jgi:low affinity Fe/Cu permease
VLVRAPSFLVIGGVDTFRLIINAATTIVTVLMVALRQDTQTRADRSTPDKLNPIADGLADVTRSIARDDPELHQDLTELRAAVSLETGGAHGSQRDAARLGVHRTIASNAFLSALGW